MITAMNRIMKTSIATLLLAALAILPVNAQQGAAAPAGSVPAEQQGRPAGAPDLFGPWKPVNFVTTLKTADGKLPPLNAAGKALYEKRMAARKAGKPIDDSTMDCLPHGMPRLMYSPYVFRIFQKPAFVAFVHEVHHMYRVAYLNEQNQPTEKLDPIYNGYPVARYEGDSLVVTSNGFNDLTTLDRAGLPHSPDMKLTERYRLINGGRQMEATFTIDDRRYYSASWTAKQVYNRVGNDQGFDEYVCRDQNPELNLK